MFGWAGRDLHLAEGPSEHERDQAMNRYGLGCSPAVF